MSFRRKMARLGQCETRIAERRCVGKILGFDLFANPAWDMLLDLYRASLLEREISISSLALASNIPASTARRCIRRLIAANLIAAHADPTDGRRIYVAITSHGVASLDQVLDRPD
jgi:DNA-binding MarR family transcriptional regulator